MKPPVFRCKPAGLGVALLALLTTVAAGASASPLSSALRIGHSLAALPAAVVTERLAPPPEELLGGDGRAAVVILLSEEPSVKAFAAAQRSGATRTARTSATRAAAQSVRDQQEVAAQALASSGIEYSELYRLQRTANAIVLRVAPEDMAALKELPGVVRVEFAPVHELTNSSSVPFVRAQEVWGNSLGLPAGAARGEGIRVGIIDSGIDYQHPSFGGTGTQVDYAANNRLIISDTIGGVPIFPTPRVVGGFDFVGDEYSAGVTPAVPDADPMDCGGHGSHVAGIAAGGGVTTANAAYAGPWDNTTNFGALKIGPGVAPRANLFALRVFGCGGSTNFVNAAIEYAVDPNNDDDFGDRLDVINMSLGSNFGQPFDLSAVASENATLTGMVVVASAGNAGDTFYITGSPGAGTQVISVASTLDNGVAGPLLINSPASIAGFVSTGGASFGVPPPPAGLTANVATVDDGSTATVPPGGATPGTVSDGCQTPFVNAAQVAGRIAFIDRGTCGFKLKARHAELAGAIGVVIGNVATSGNPTVAPGMGDDPAVPAVNIPVVSVNLASANNIRANFAAPVNLTMFTGADTASGFTSRGSRGGGSAFRLKPDMAAPGTSIISVQTGITCTNVAPSTGCITPNPTGFIPGGASLNISGTSMAAPHVAGMMALLRQLNPTRSPEELKAIALSSAAHDVSIGPNGTLARYPASRVGSGRMNVALAASGQILAYNADEEGAGGVAFDFEPTSSAPTKTANVRIVNRRAAPATVDLSIDTVLNAPGVAYSIDGPSTVTIPGPGSITVVVRLTANVDQMDRSIDPTMSPTQAVGAPASLQAFGSVARHYIAEESALLKVSQAGTERARVALSAGIRPHSRMQSQLIFPIGAPPSGSVSLALSGDDVCSGTAGTGTCTAARATEQESLVSPFELQVRGVLNPALPGYASIQYAGLNFDPATSSYLFGISTFGEWATLGNVAFNVCIDNNEDGVFDRVVFSSDLGQFARLAGQNVSGQDTFMSGVFNPTPPASVNFGVAASPRFLNLVSAAVADTAVHDTNVAFFSATAADLGLAAGDTTFRYALAVCPGFNPLCIRLAAPATSCASGGAFQSIAGPFNYNSGAQGITTTGGAGGSPVLFPDIDGATLPVSFNQANLRANGSSGLLLLHHHNVNGMRAQVVQFDNLFSDGFEETP